MCRYLNNKNGKPECVMNNSAVCPFKWWCTNSKAWKDYEGSEHCGMMVKAAAENWFLIKEWNGNIAICKNGSGLERIEVPEKFIKDGKKPIAIKYFAEVEDVIY